MTAGFQMAAQGIRYMYTAPNTSSGTTNPARQSPREFLNMTSQMTGFVVIVSSLSNVLCNLYQRKIMVILSRGYNACLLIYHV